MSDNSKNGEASCKIVLEENSESGKGRMMPLDEASFKIVMEGNSETGKGRMMPLDEALSLMSKRMKESEARFKTYGLRRPPPKDDEETRMFHDVCRKHYAAFKASGSLKRSPTITPLSPRKKAHFKALLRKQFPNGANTTVELWKPNTSKPKGDDTQQT